jgi:two-component system, chemotaxis family, CheB/CheR fusion protein
LSLSESNVKEISNSGILFGNGSSDFPIVGVGASAGGLEALELFFKNVPNNCGMAFVVIQHLDPNHVCLLPELLQRCTTMKVLSVTDRQKVKPNYIYVIPPNKSMSILNGVLHLFAQVELHGLRLPIDIFFRSMANDLQERSIGIILSGMGSDGSLGLKSIKEKNGVVLVQDPLSAKFDGMPRSASAAVIADIIAPANELPLKLITYLRFYSEKKTDNEKDSKIVSNIDKIIILLREQTGHDFSLYKKKTLFRRIERRKDIHQIDKIQSYVRFLQENPKETEILFKELLIGVTNFFRDPDVWESLREKVFPSLISKFPNGHTMRAWVVGCSTGEEAYSLAIIFKETMGKYFPHKNITLQIFATDLDTDAIELAHKGIFSKNIINDVSPERISRFFLVEGENYRVSNAIREMVVFAAQDVIKDPPFTKLDFLSCRNMLIYFELELQKKLMPLYCYSLNVNGVMVLGASETLGSENEGFKEIDSKLKIYQRSPTIRLPELIDFPSSFHRSKTPITAKRMSLKWVENIQTLADQVVLQRYAPASVLVNNKGDIVYITGRTGKYLEPAAGKANWNIYAMARENLRQELPVAIRKATQSSEPVLLHKIKFDNNGKILLVNVTVQCIDKPDQLQGMIMLVFNDLPEEIEFSKLKTVTGKRGSIARLKELEVELHRRFEELQVTREEMQTSQEELKSTNEELQSTNEELTTSKEEMQSLNEQLQTVNMELQCRVTDYEQANDDMKNLLNSTEIATLFLDRDLNIRRYTDLITKVFKLRHADIGRPFTDLVTDLQYPEIDTHARQVLKTLISNERAIATNDGRWFNVRIMPYRTLDDRIDGSVITFNDITAAKKM